MKKINLILAIILTLALYSPFAYAGAYSWTDQNGVRHSSDVPPSEYMKQQKEVAQPNDDELPPEVTQTLFNKKGTPVVPATDADKKAPEYKPSETKQNIIPPPGNQTPVKKQAVKSPPKDETTISKPKSTIPPKPQAVETQKKKAVPPPAPTVEPAPVLSQPPTKKRIRFYKNQVARLKELIKSQEELIAEDVRTIGLIENRINHIKAIQGPKSDRLKNELQQSEKSLEAAKSRLKTDVRELQGLQNNVRNYQLKLKPAK